MSVSRSQEFIRIDTGAIVTLEFDAQHIGQQGSFGSVHDLNKINGSLVSNWVIKLLNRDLTPDFVLRLTSLCEFLNDGDLNVDGLSCVPMTVLRGASSDHAVVIMRKASGPDLAMTRNVPTSTLPRRLAAAYELARCIDKLHNRGVVVGDIAHNNIIIDPNNWALYVIDLDGIGFSHAKASFAVDGTNLSKGEVAPPEAAIGDVLSSEADLWSLGVLIHDILCSSKPMEMFGLHRSYGRKPLTPIQWPPSENRQAQSHSEALDRFGHEVKSLILRAFNEGHSEPAKRPAAREWVDALNRAQDYIYRCPCQPDDLFVAIGPKGQMSSCFHCQSPIAAR